MVLIVGNCWFINPLGPDFSYHSKSVVCVAMFCPHRRLVFGESRWVTVGKNASRLKNENIFVFIIFLDVIFVMSVAINNPNRDTRRAKNFIMIGMVKI